MLLLTMTHQEVYSEIQKDLPNVQRWNEHRDSTYHRMSLKVKKFPAHLFSEYVSPRKNRWLITTRFFRKNDFASTFGVLQHQNGIVLHQTFVHMQENSFSTVCTFLPHFFERYAERNKLNIKGFELIKYVVKNDCSFNIDRTHELSGEKDRGREDNVHICMKNGVGFGYEVGNKHYLIKTFLTYDMTYGVQRQTFESKKHEIIDLLDDSKPVPLPRLDSALSTIEEKDIEKLRRKLSIT